MAFELSISPGSASPIFKQIVDQVRLGVATGSLAVGDQLPSVRALAERLIVNPNTIARAYAELTREGIVDGRRGKGLFVAGRRQMYTKTERLRRIGPLIDAVAHEGLSLGFTPAEMVETLENKLKKMGLPGTEKKDEP
jgi:GntR family transcriptional regulator